MKFVRLSITQRFSYYLFPIILTGFGVIPIVFWATGNTNHNLTPLKANGIGIIFLVFAGLVFYLQRQRLQYQILATDIPLKLKNKIVRTILRDHGWSYVRNEYNFIQVNGNGFRKESLDLRTWFEMMTFELNSEGILVNSICDPDGLFPQPFSFGKNKQNVQDFGRLFEEYTTREKMR
jgi:hypothetical protein